MNFSSVQKLPFRVACRHFSLFSVPVISIGNTCHISAALDILQALPFYTELLRQRHCVDGLLDVLSDVWHAAREDNNFVRNSPYNVIFHTMQATLSMVREYLNEFIVLLGIYYNRRIYVTHDGMKTGVRTKGNQM